MLPALVKGISYVNLLIEWFHKIREWFSFKTSQPTHTTIQVGGNLTINLVPSPLLPPKRRKRPRKTDKDPPSEPPN